MERQKFKPSHLGGILSVTISIVVILIVYNVLNHSLVLVFFLIPVADATNILKTKLIIENGNLRYEKLIQTQEVTLEDVAIIMLKEQYKLN